MSENQNEDDKTQTHVLLSAGTMIDHYRIVEKIGAGGMGEVYLAEDTKLNRKIALKFLPPHLCQDETCRARFVREAQAAAKLNHPNIMTVYEVSEYQNRPFIAMEFIDGKTLGEIIAADRMPLSQVIRLMIGLGKGLEQAHAAGIIHRDIKPTNIIVDTNGIAKILDFGLANVPDAAGLTEKGMTMGTAAYMSPEHIAGGTVDRRSDLFSLGTVLYEMITGQSPFRKENVAATLHAVAYDAPPPLSEYRTDISEGLQKIVAKALEKKPESRYQSASHMLADLRAEKNVSDATIAPSATRTKKRRPMVVIGAPILLIIAVLIFQPWKTGHEIGHNRTQSSQASIAVLAFANLSADPGQEYFCDGMTEEIINALAEVPGLRVVARTSSFAFKGRDEDIRDIGGKLNVGMVLEGSVRKSGDRLRITAQLINVDDGYQLWSNQYDKNIEDVFAIQDDISRAIVDSLRFTLTGQQDTLGNPRHPADIEAYHYYLKGRYHWNQRTPEGLFLSIDYYHKAIGVDSNYALAYAGLADAYIVLADHGIQAPAEAYENAKRFTKRALKIDPTLTQALVADAFISFGFDWEWKTAESKFLRAIGPNANYATGYQWYAEYLSAMGRHEEAEAMVQKALALDPLSAIINTASGAVAERARRYDDAIAGCKAALELNPNFIPAMYMMMLSYFNRQDYDEATIWLKNMMALDTSDTGLVDAVDRAYREDGIRGTYRWLIDDYLRRGKYYNTPYYLAASYAVLGERDSAFIWLDRGYELRCHNMNEIKVNPDLDSLRSDPRFDALLRKMNLLE